MAHPTHLPHKLAKAVKHGTDQVHSGPKTWNVYVDQPRSKGSFVVGLLLGAAGAAYFVVSKSQGAREELTDRVGTLKTTARERVVEVADRAKPHVQDFIEKATSVVTEATEAVREKTEDVSAASQDKVEETVDKVKPPRPSSSRSAPPPTSNL